MVQPGVSALGKKNRTTVLPRKSFSETGFSSWSSKVKSGALSLACMRNSPSNRTLYRIASSAVICLALVLGAVSALRAQIARTDAKSKGPRATGLLQLPEKGKPRLIPICIMVDGRFFDAGIYKADPIPMALEGGTVYEAERTGQSIGLFTVRNVLQQQQTKAWIAEGDWLAAGAAPPKPTAMQAESKPREEEEDKPPTLRRPAKTSPEKPSETKPVQSPNPAPGAPTPNTANTPDSSTSSGASPASAPPPEAKEEDDPSRPHLRRGVPPRSEPTALPSKMPPQSASRHHNTATFSTAKPATQVVPAISDADGPEPRPYTYDMKPEEEQAFRRKMLALATSEISTQRRPDEEQPTAAKRARRAAKPSAPSFEDVSLRVFDVATNNEPILVLTAKAVLPAPPPQAPPVVPASSYVTVVARSDFNGDLRKLMTTVTDDRHLDVTPRMEMIDAVDVDGDGRGEFLFRKISNGGVGYIVYRVTPDRLWTLFESRPSGQ